MSTQDLAGRVALVTGASSGMGFAAAQALLRRGARVAISSRGGAKLEAARAALVAERADDAEAADAGETAEVAAFAADLSSADAIAELHAQVAASLGAVDILVANGGGPPSKPTSEVTEADWQAAFTSVFLFVPRLCREVLPAMRARRWGRIVAINSVSARQPIPNLALSNSFRPAVVGYLKTLSQEVAAEGVTVNTVLPGYTLTGRQDELAGAAAQRSGKSKEEIVAAWAANTAIGRMADPAEIGEVIAFLCSPAASYLTGQAVTVDGGYVKSLL